MQGMRRGISTIDPSERDGALSNPPFEPRATTPGGIGEWWFEKAQEELDKTIPKAEQYGSGDLVVMAAALRLQLPASVSRDLPDKFFMEWACAYYALGKVARVIAAYARGDDPGPDNWFDLGVYCRMAQFIREKGRWI